jgi:hypothetical protein
MNLQELKTLLRQEATRAEDEVAGAVWYLFGSVLRKFEDAVDIDLLIVCDSEKAVGHMRNHMRMVCSLLPLHLLLLTKSEETELGFVVAEQCAQLYPV